MVKKKVKVDLMYQILEAWEDCPDDRYNEAAVREELESYLYGNDGKFELVREPDGLLNVKGTAFFLRPLGVSNNDDMPDVQG